MCVAAALALQQESGASKAASAFVDMEKGDAR
jgi:hypothetical protein